MRATEAALELARSGFQPSDLVSVATYSKANGIQILTGFSSDRVQLEAALDNLGLVNPFDQISDPLRLMIAELDGGWDGPRSSKGVLIEQLKDLSTFTNRNTLDQKKQQILDLSANLDELAGLMDSVSGRKQIVLFSQGFDSEVVFGTTDSERIEETAANVQSGQLWRVDSEERFGSSNAQSALLQMLERFNRSDCAVHTVDTGGLAADGDTGASLAGDVQMGGSRLNRSHDGLAMMANETGGQFYRNLNNLNQAMDDLMERTSVTYVVSIRPKKVAMDGAYHPIKIRLKDVPNGVRISHRPGYTARRPYSELDPMQRQLLTAERLIAGLPGGDFSTNLLAAAFPGSGDKANVLTAIEVAGSGLTSSATDNIVNATIYVYAFDEQGQIRDFLSQAVVLDLYKVGYQLDTGFKLLGHLELPAGDYEIRSLVRNVRTGTSSLSVTKASVPAFAEGETALLPPFFIEPDGVWLVGDADRTEETQTPYPLMGAGMRMIPASEPRLVSGQPIPVLLVGYRLPADLEAGGRLIGDDGSIHENVTIVVGRRLSDRGEGERLLAEFLASDIGPGSYRLEVTLRGDGREISSSLPVRILAFN